MLHLKLTVYYKWANWIWTKQNKTKTKGCQKGSDCKLWRIYWGRQLLRHMSLRCISHMQEVLALFQNLLSSPAQQQGAKLNTRSRIYHCLVMDCTLQTEEFWSCNWKGCFFPRSPVTKQTHFGQKSHSPRSQRSINRCWNEPMHGTSVGRHDDGELPSQSQASLESTLMRRLWIDRLSKSDCPPQCGRVPWSSEQNKKQREFSLPRCL